MQSALPVRGDDLTNVQLGIVTVGRLSLITAFRILYPLLPFLSDQLNVDLTTISVLVTVQLLVSIVSPLGGMLADTRGERLTMLLGMGLFCIGALVCALGVTFAWFFVGYTLIGLGLAIYQPAAQSYLSARSSYARRGRALGVFETSWAAAALVGVFPLMELVQRTSSTSLTFWILLGVGIASLWLMGLALPPTPRHASAERIPIDWAALRTQSAIAVLLFIGLVLMAYEVYLVAQASWLKDAFDADERTLGQIYGVVGIAELIGSFGVIAFVDRIGKRRSVALSFALSALLMLLLPFTAGNWVLLLIAVFCFYACIEFAIVAAIPLMSGVAPTARGTLMALSVAVVGVSRVGGAQISAPLYLSAGMLANAALGATVMALSLLLLLRVREVE
ncbi:MAG TPA: MFS transporter [Roseiflexaceae bacterium]|nr:MFS transporter [Roseiflexaceae bacterium]